MNNNFNITRRMSRDKSYNPNNSEKTYQSTLSQEEIAKKLEDYVLVPTEEINTIQIGTHIRYFNINPKTGEKQFRMGGFLTKIADKYIVCNNGNLSWCIQFANNIIYKKLSNVELKENIIKTTTETNNQVVDNLIEENKQLKKMIKEIKETTIKAKEAKKNLKK